MRQYSVELEHPNGLGWVTIAITRSIHSARKYAKPHPKVRIVLWTGKIVR